MQMGANFKFIHCSDIHLDTPFRRISSYDPALGKRMMTASFDALDRIIDRAISERVDFIVFAGDIFDSRFGTPRSRSYFADAVRRSGIRCYIAYGNHDHERRWEKSIPLPPNAVVFPDTPVNIPDPDEENKVADVIGVSHSMKEEGRDLTADINGTAAFSIAVVHCDLDTVSEGRRYAPCRLRDLLDKGIDYWALGHVHTRNVVHTSPHVVYPGNTQGRSINEAGEKGAYIVTVEDGKVTGMEFFVTGTILWAETEISITGKDIVSLLDELGSRTSPGSLIRIAVTGHGILDRMIRLERESFTEMAERRTGCTVVDLDIRCSPEIDIEERRRVGDFISAVINGSDHISAMSRDDIIRTICRTKASLSAKDIFESMDDDELRDMVSDARLSLFERLAGGGG
jgi:DNA repair exonuclease SbcCD nuclease subunit